MHLENVVVNTDTAAKVPITAARAANSHMEHAVAVLHLVQYQAEEAAQGEVLVLDKRRRMILAEARKSTFALPQSAVASMDIVEKVPTTAERVVKVLLASVIDRI